MPDTELDQFDRKILAALQENNQASAHVLAETIPLSPSAILRRIRGFRHSGVIAADVSILNPDMLGGRLSVLFLLQLESHDPAALEGLRTLLIETPQVQTCLAITGGNDMMCLATFRNMAEFNAFADKQIGPHPMVKRYEASLVKRRVKTSMTFPL